MDEVRRSLRDEPKQDLEVRFATTRGQGHIAKSALLMPIVGLRMMGRLLGRGPDVQHINLSSNGSALRKILIAWLARHLGIPYVLHLHGSGFREYWTGAPSFIAARIRAMFAHAARTLVLGQVWRNFILERVPEIADRITILPNAVPAPAAREARRDGPVVILFLGQVGPRKGVPQLVEALASLSPDEDWVAIIAGNGQVEETRAEVARRGLAPRVRLTGWIGPDEVRSRLAQADIVVLPSFEENLPMSVIEGMAYGLAVVTTPVGAVEDIVEDGITGLLVPPGDAAGLGRALAATVSDPDLRRRLGSNARAFHRQHLEIGGYIERLTAVWREVAAQTR